MNHYMNAMLASFWEDLKTGSGGPTMIVLMIVAAAAIVLLLVCLVLLARRSTVILDEGEGKKQVIKTGRYKAVDLPEPSRDGYTFAGWYTDAACTAPAGKLYRRRQNRSLFMRSGKRSRRKKMRRTPFRTMR